MSDDQVGYSPAENAAYVKRAYLKNAAYPFAIMAVAFAIANLYPPAEMLSSYVQVVAYIIGGAAAGYYFSQELDRRGIHFQTRDGLILWAATAISLAAAVFAIGIPIRVLVDGRTVASAISGIARTIYGQIQAGPAGLVLALFGIAIGHDMYHQQFTMLKPLSREKRAEVREVAHSVQPLIEARHRFGRSFTRDQLAALLPDESEWGDIDETMLGLREQGVLELREGVITITPKGENLLTVSRFVGGFEEKGEEGSDICAYCGRPLKLSDKLMRINYYGEPRLMHYAEREGVRIFGRLPYIDKVLGLKPAEVVRPAYEEVRVLPTVDHRAALALGLLGAAFAMASYVWIITNADSLPIPTEVSFFGGTLLAVSLIFALCGVIGGLWTYVNPGGSYGGAMMLSLLFFATPFVALTMEMVFGGYYAAVGLIAVGGLISVRARTRMA